MVDIYLHKQNKFIYLMMNQYTLGIYTSVDSATEALKKVYETMKEIK